MGKYGKIPYHIPDWNSWRVEDVPELVQLQKKLARKGLKDPWLRNEVWRFQPGLRPVPFYQPFVKGFKWGFAAFVIAVGLEKLFSSNTNEGGHH